LLRLSRCHCARSYALSGREKVSMKSGCVGNFPAIAATGKGKINQRVRKIAWSVQIVLFACFVNRAFELVVLETC
jgi:hypothetical protein